MVKSDCDFGELFHQLALKMDKQRFVIKYIPFTVKQPRTKGMASSGGPEVLSNRHNPEIVCVYIYITYATRRIRANMPLPVPAASTESLAHYPATYSVSCIVCHSVQQFFDMYQLDSTGSKMYLFKFKDKYGKN